MAAMVALGSTITMASTATAVTLEVSVENLGPTNGSYFSSVWTSFHNGSFDLFDVASPASSAVENLAEFGFTGLDTTIPGYIDAFQIFIPGFDGNFPSNLFPPDSLLSSSFSRSSAGVNGGVQSLLFTDDFSVTLPGNFSPGKTVKKTITLDGNFPSYRYFSYATKVFPSNDAFIGNDDPIEIFDSEGNFIGADFIVTGNQVLDAGTEVNDEDRSTLFPLFAGVRENGTIQTHPGSIKPVGSGGVLDIESRGVKIFTKADFKAPGYQVARIKITQVPEPATTASLFALAGLFMLTSHKMLNRSRESSCFCLKSLPFTTLLVEQIRTN